MVTMLSGSALMDGALFVIASSAKCPQAQDREHLLAAESVGIKNLVIVQNKVDVVTKERALENYKEIRAFVKGTIADGAPIVPISAQHGTNIDILLREIEDKIPTPRRDQNAPPRMYVLRSFEVNKPGTDVDDLVGGVIGGSIVQGIFRIGDEIEIKPGIPVQEGGKTKYERLLTTVRSLSVSKGSVTEAKSGGLVGLGTDLDPFLTKSDGLVGSVVGRIDTLPTTLGKITLDVKLFERVVGTELAVPVEKIRSNEALVLNIGTTVTSGLVTSAREDLVDVGLRKPVCADPGAKIAVSRRISDSWRLIGFGTLKA
jgi:translation initiation factor 2 subunit 3